MTHRQLCTIRLIGSFSLLSQDTLNSPPMSPHFCDITTLWLLRRSLLLISLQCGFGKSAHRGYKLAANGVLASTFLKPKMTNGTYGLFEFMIMAIFSPQECKCIWIVPFWTGQLTHSNNSFKHPELLRSETSCSPYEWVIELFIEPIHSKMLIHSGTKTSNCHWIIHSRFVQRHWIMLQVEFWNVKKSHLIWTDVIRQFHIFCFYAFCGFLSC